MPGWLDLLLFRTWWRFRPGADPWVESPYHLFNLFEGTAWLVFGVLVFVRYGARRHSSLEVWYALAFFAFGMTDYLEAYALTSWLLWIKLANLILLMKLRATVIRRYYPTSRLY
ncbi:hypothetical protein ACYOEI_28975 [Singulisphaera rosea]